MKTLDRKLRIVQGHVCRVSTDNIRTTSKHPMLTNTYELNYRTAAKTIKDFIQRIQSASKPFMDAENKIKLGNWKRSLKTYPRFCSTILFIIVIQQSIQFPKLVMYIEKWWISAIFGGRCTFTGWRCIRKGCRWWRWRNFWSFRRIAARCERCYRWQILRIARSPFFTTRLIANRTLFYWCD